MAFDELRFLSRIKAKPGAFFGEPSLTGLRDLLTGMEWGAKIVQKSAGLPENRLFPVFLSGFLPWYERRYKKDGYSTSCWGHMLYVSFGLEWRAFEFCFHCFEEYLTQELGLSLPPAEPWPEPWPEPKPEETNDTGEETACSAPS